MKIKLSILKICLLLLIRSSIFFKFELEKNHWCVYRIIFKLLMKYFTYYYLLYIKRQLQSQVQLNKEGGAKTKTSCHLIL